MNAVCLLICTTLLGYILKYRVHIHVTVTMDHRGSETTDRASRGASGRRDSRRRTADRVDVLRDERNRDCGPAAHSEVSTMQRDVESALRNLGCSREYARAAASASADTNDFDEALRKALHYATTKEAA